MRRLDYVINAFQCLVETLMFYHPVAWWISRCIREERENCCDDLVIEVCGDRLAYTRALAATMEGLRGELPDLAFAVSGGSLLNRIRRLLGVPNDKGSVSGWQVARLAVLGISLVIIALGVRLAVGSHPLSVTFLRWSDTPVFPANASDEFRSRFPKGEYRFWGLRTGPGVCGSTLVRWSMSQMVAGNAKQ